MAGSKPLGSSNIYCEGSADFNPDSQVKRPEINAKALEQLRNNDLYGAITTWFSLPSTDTYTYHALGSVRLREVQHVIGLGDKNGLHSWYRDQEGKPLPAPALPDIDAYVAIFSPQTATVAALKALGSNAKKGSLRASVATHLTFKRYLHPSLTAELTIPKRKSAPANPYLDFWAWSCRNLEWAGPSQESEAAGASQSHHILPILMHHFGCACPSYEALEILRIMAAGRPVLDVGSGNGYWTFQLRQHGVVVTPIDNQQSSWRVSWLRPEETIIADGARWLSRPANKGGADAVLLLVYPVVGEDGQGSFTRGLLAAYRGDTVAVVGTQNRNGYTSFANRTFDEYMAAEQTEWTRTVQIPLPSFAGKDEALFVYQRGERAPR